ncbi:hypothetical protein E3O44_07210 [Cryobacterium algoricola]|uniref:Uncharacterized protein n=1 Tax=Cryobacterium algoricola TaxID=1259183 RepID=A0ABY2IBJ1_9MICO|nr:hypothetical protein [Cryobacterium algoricola]TFB86945.1 hypothetical protein E3O44_07210 [Cryobacterium algoricola]
MKWQWRSIGLVWAFAVVCSVLTGALAAPGHSIVWIGLSLAGCTIATLSIQLATGQKEGYVHRVTVSLVGVVVVLAAATGIFALAGLL